MGLIDIDDRDVNNHYYQSVGDDKATHKLWLMELKTNNPTAKINSLGAGIYQIGLPIIACTGSIVSTRFNIPTMHQLLRMSIKHTDNGGINSVDTLNYSLLKRGSSNLLMTLISITSSTASDIMDKYVDYYMELGEYLIESNTTNTDQLNIDVMVRVMGA